MYQSVALIAVTALALGCGSGEHHHDAAAGDARTTDAELASFCQSLRDQWAAFVATAATDCTSAEDCVVLGGDDCGGSLPLSASCWGDPIARSALYHETSHLQSQWAARCSLLRGVTSDCANGVPACRNARCGIGPECVCMCPPQQDAGQPPSDAAGDAGG